MLFLCFCHLLCLINQINLQLYHRLITLMKHYWYKLVESTWIFVSVISERSLNTFRPPSAMMEFQWVTSVKLIHCKTWFTLASAATAAISDSILSQFLPLSVPPSVNLTQLHAKIYQEQGLVNVVSLTS